MANTQKTSRRIWSVELLFEQFGLGYCINQLVNESLCILIYFLWIKNIFKIKAWWSLKIHIYRTILVYNNWYNQRSMNREGRRSENCFEFWDLWRFVWSFNLEGLSIIAYLKFCRNYK
jgi:hypothetical protein